MSACAEIVEETQRQDVEQFDRQSEVVLIGFDLLRIEEQFFAKSVRAFQTYVFEAGDF